MERISSKVRARSGKPSSARVTSEFGVMGVVSLMRWLISNATFSTGWLRRTPSPEPSASSNA
jgi:hypothetical protein